MNIWSHFLQEIAVISGIIVKGWRRNSGPTGMIALPMVERRRQQNKMKYANLTPTKSPKEMHDAGFINASLRWRHNGHNGVSNHQPYDCLFNRLFRRRSKKTSKLRVTDLCVGNSPGTGEFSAQMASNAENVSIWWRHRDIDYFARLIYNECPLLWVISSHWTCPQQTSMKLMIYCCLVCILIIK